MLPMAIKSVLYAGAIAGIVVLVIMIGWLGLERTSAVVMALAFALAPADTLNVSFLGVSDILFFLAVGLAFPRLLGTPLILPAAFVLGSLVFITIGLLSSVAADDATVYYYTARVIFTFVILPIMVVWWAPRGMVLVWLLVAYAVGNGISVVYGIPSAGGLRNFGLSQHPNALGYTSMLTLSLIPFLFVALSRKWRNWICGAAVAGAGVGILTSGSRAALVVAVGLILLVPAVERSIPLALTVAIAGVSAIGILGQRPAPTQGQDALSRLLGAGPVEGSDQARLEGVAKVWQTALDHPWLGTGFRLVEFNGHNVYVQVAAAVGFIGLAGLIAILISMVTPLFATGNIHSRLVYPAIAVIAAGPVSPNLTDRYFGLLLGIALVGGNIVRAERHPEVEDLETLPLRRLNK
jgi:hypothetical protein